MIMIVSLLLACTSWGQINFFKLFTNNGADFGHGVVQLEDSSYVITGSSSSFGATSQAFLLKIDSMGNYLWSNQYGGTEMEQGRRVLYKDDFGFFICGYTNSMGNGGFDYYLAKVDEDANLEWEKAIGGYGWEKVHDAAMTRDTGTIMVGETSSNPTDNLDMYIVRTDIAGDTLWTRTYGGSGDDYLSSIRQHNDSMYVVGGRKWIADSAMFKGYMAYIKDDGTLMWEDTMGINGSYWINDVEVEDTRFVGIGGTSGGGKDGIDFYFYPVDFGGGALGPLESPNPGDENFQHITTYGPADDFYIASTNIDQWSYEGGVDVRVSKFLTNMAWQNGFAIGHPDPDVPGDIIRTSDGGALVVGYTTGVISGGNEVFVAKIGPGNANFPNPQMDLIVDAIVSVEEVIEDVDMAIYPNPASTGISIETSLVDYTDVALRDASGKLVASEKMQLTTSMNVSQLSDGWYILEISGDGVKPVRRKVVVHH